MRIQTFLAKVCMTGLALTATAGLWSALPADAATRPQPITACGQTITKASAYLTGDLTCSQGFGVPSNATSTRDVTLDLRGHRLQGPGSGTAISVGAEFPYFASLQLKNGRLDHWGTAVSAAWASVELTNVTLDHNALALNCAASSCTVSNSRIESNTVGNTTNDAALLFTDNVFRGNGTASDASSLSGFSGATYTDNSFDDNTVGVRIAPGIGVRLTGNRFSNNVVAVKGTDPNGFGTFQAQLTDNRFVGNRDGIYLALNSENSAVLKGNVAIRNTRYGIYAPGAEDAGGNRAVRNGKPCVGVVCARP
jgi:parallel beta-helix repeat protein